VTLVEITAVTDETPYWWDGRRLLGLDHGGRSDSPDETESEDLR
jgi:hypothetical protein